MVLVLKDATGRDRKVIIALGDKTHSVNVTEFPGNREGAYDFNQHYLKLRPEDWYKKFSTYESFMEAVHEAQYRDLS